MSQTSPQSNSQPDLQPSQLSSSLPADFNNLQTASEDFESELDFILDTIDQFDKNEPMLSLAEASARQDLENEFNEILSEVSDEETPDKESSLDTLVSSEPAPVR